jgi:GST-like protein
MIDLYTVPTANGQRASVMLEEVGLPYNVHVIDMVSGGHAAAEFLAINPLGMAPAMVDHDGPDGQAATLFETLAICYYLAEKTGQLMPKDGIARVEAHKWAVMVAADLGPAFAGQYYFKVAAQPPVPFGVDLYETRATRFLKAMDDRLADNEFLAGDAYTIADVMAYPSATSSASRMDDGIAAFSNVVRWVDTVGARPAVQKGMAVPA